MMNYDKARPSMDLFCDMDQQQCEKTKRTLDEMTQILVFSMDWLIRIILFSSVWLK